MKTISIFVVALIVSLSAKAQFTLEQVYDSAGTWNVAKSKSSQLMYINLEVSGPHYIKVNRSGRNLQLYTLNHALVKSINLSSLPMGNNTYALNDILCISEKLFNTDNKLEFMHYYTVNGQGGNTNFVTEVYNENLTLLFRDTAAPLIKANFPQQQFPIYNTPNGTKMILTTNTGEAKVYGLTGTLTASVRQVNESLLEDAQYLAAPVPNPNAGVARIPYQLPSSAEEGEIILFDVSGKQVSSYKVSNAFSTIEIGSSELSAGTYFYQLKVNGESIGSKKMLVIK